MLVFVVLVPDVVFNCFLVFGRGSRIYEALTKTFWVPPDEAGVTVLFEMPRATALHSPVNDCFELMTMQLLCNIC